MSSDNDHDSLAKELRQNSVISRILIGGLVLGLLVSFIVYASEVSGKGRSFEHNISETFNKTQQGLANCLQNSDIKNQLSEDEDEFGEITGILVRLASAEYINQTGQPAALNDVILTGDIIKTLNEKYPQVGRQWVYAYDMLIDCHGEYRANLAMIQATSAMFVRWRQDETFMSFWPKSEFPSKELKLHTASGKTFYGQQALDYITKPLPVDEAVMIIVNGEEPNNDPFYKR